MKHADDTPTLQQLIAGLQSPDVLVRYAAALDLGEMGDPRAVEPLIAALGDSEGYVQRAALTALGRLGDERAVQPIVAFVTSDDVRGLLSGFDAAPLAVSSLRQLGEPGYDALLRMLHEYGDDEAIGTATAYTLGESGDPRAIPVLIEALHSKVYDVRLAGAQALADLGEPALAALLDMLRNGLRAWEGSLYPICQALIFIGASAIAPLIDVLRTSDDENARMIAVTALGNIGAYCEGLEESLHRVLHEAVQSALGDTDSDVRLEAALRLGDMHDASGLAILLAALDSTNERDARDALSSLENVGPKAVEPLLAILADTSRAPEVRVRAVEVLSKVGDTQSIPGLLAALKDDDRRVRMVAENALGKLKGQEVMEPLREVLASAAAEGDADERLTTLIALAKVGDTSVIPALLDVITSPVDENASPHSSFAEGIRAASSLMQAMGAARALADLKEPGIEALRTIIVQDNQWIARCALQALDARDEAAQPILLAAARDPRPHIRSIGLSVLWKLWDDTLTAQCLYDLRSPDPDIRRAAASALERHAKALPAAASEPLIAVLDDENLWVRYHAARTLRVVGDERAIQPLLRCRANTTGTLPASDVKRDCMTAVLAIFHRSRAMWRQAETT